MNLEKERLLIIAPHAEDEILGCFGLINTIKKHLVCGSGDNFVDGVPMESYIFGGEWKCDVVDMKHMH